MQCAVMEARPLKNLPEYDPDVLLAPVECLNHITCKYLHRNRLLLKGCKHPRKTRDINAYFKENEHFLYPSALEVKMKTANIYNRIGNRQRKFSSKSKGSQVRSRSVSTQNNSEGRRIREAASDITYSTEYRQVGPSIGNTSDSHRRSSRERKSVYETYNLEHVWDADYQYWLSNLKKIRKSKQTEEEKDDSVLSSGQVEHTTSSVVGENNHVVQELAGNEHREYPHPYQCDICKEVFVVMRSFRKHLKTHPESSIYKCTDCNYEGKTKRSLSTHVKVHHTGSNSYKCDTCHKVFKRKSYLTVHKVSHCGRRFTCLVCGKKFKFKAVLKTHMFSHSEEFPYECDACGKGFNQSAALKVHKRSHTGERPFKCMHCPKAFPSQTNRDAHVRTHTGEKPYKCLVCGKCFSDPGACKRHRLIHTGEKPHKCSHCGRRFNDTGARDRHERLHTGLKPFQCDVCDKRFRDSSGLITHTRYHTGERFKCDLCGKKFIVKGGLNAHMKTHAKLTVHAR